MNRESHFRPGQQRSPGWWSLLVLAGVSLSLPACSSDGHFSILGYSTAGNFDRQYKTVRVPIFQNRTYYRGLEFMLTQEVVNQIEQRSPYKVVTGDDAHLELMGRILTFSKNNVLSSPVNEQRVDDLAMTVEILLKDLRTGQILSRPPKRPLAAPGLEEVPGLQDVPPPDLQAGMIPFPNVPVAPGGLDQPAVMNNGPNGPAPLLPPPPPPRPGYGPQPLGGIIIRSTSTFIPELGQSITSGEQRLTRNTAVQIVNMMEKPW